MRIPLALNMPVFKDDAPSELMKLPIRKQSYPYLQGYESDYFCLMCRQVVTIFDYKGSEEMKYQLKMEEWSNRSMYLKLIERLRGLKRPVKPWFPSSFVECPVCDQSVFLEENEPCYDCEAGVFIIDEKSRIIY
jgi:hypothetical protein